MSVSYTAYAILGFRAGKNQFYKYETLPLCGHRPPAAAKFCAECGRTAWGPQALRIEGYTNYPGRTFVGFQAVEAGDYVYVGVVRNNDSYHYSEETEIPKDLSRFFALLSQELLSASIGTDPAFPALWAVLEAS